ncbi:MAG: SDR family NAD(P)-dependent oxidoreductase [Bacteroidetes bacterium]|nr:SDR family NAD(P)-dependent oxidoreductase [Bacteroidota bacterium]
MNKIVSVVTGASRGIGEAIARKFAEEKHSLAIFGRDEEKLSRLAKELTQLGSKVLVFTGDVGDPQFVDNSIKKVLEEFDQIDHLVNNAGVAIFKKFEDTSLEEFQLQINANLYGVFNFSKSVLSSMIERKSGSIINISSLAGKNGFQYGTTYSATKHAVMGFTKSLMLEVREHNIRVAAVCPGSVVTDMIMNSDMKPSKPEKILDPMDVAEVVASIIKLPPRALISEVEIRPTNPK